MCTPRQVKITGDGYLHLSYTQAHMLHTLQLMNVSASYYMYKCVCSEAVLRSCTFLVCLICN